MNLILQDDIDFAAYARETEPARKVRPASVFMQDLIEGLGREDQEAKAFLPWEKTHPLVQLRRGEVTLWAGVNGHGKSIVTGQVAVSLCAQDEKVCVASFEMKPKRTLERMARQFSGQEPKGEWMHDARVVQSFRDLYRDFSDFTKKRLWLYDQQGTTDPETILGVVRYCAKELGITHFFVDSLMKCVRGEDDYNGQKALVDELTAVARDYDMHIHVVHHIRKASSEDHQPDKMDIKGSGAITDQADNVLIVWRNKKKERDLAAGKTVAPGEPDALVICDKQRNGEWEGRIGLWFERASQQFVEHAGGEPLCMWNWPHRGSV